MRASPVDACAAFGSALGFSSRIFAVAFGGGRAFVVVFGSTISALATGGGAGDGLVSGSAFCVVAPAIWVAPPVFAPVAPPKLIVSLHSFTPSLTSRPEELRPWHCGVLYNEDERGARLAIPLLEAEGLIIGDQQPYSGKLLNATMNRHAEAHGRAYFGIEIRQDLIGHDAGQAEWAERLARVANGVALALP